MRALLLAAMILGGAIGSIEAQKKSTIMGDVVIGELTGRDEATREITLKYPGKDGPEIFSGILVDGYKLKTADGGPSDLKLDEIVPGTRIRVFYKTGQEKVNGQEKKINKVSRIDFLGKDEYVRLRSQLNVEPSTVVTNAEKGALPASSPLKVYLAIAYGDVHRHLVAWINKWNQKNGDQYGKLEIADFEHADILIVVAQGADTNFLSLPAMVSGVEGEWSHGTSYLVLKDPGALKVLWTSIAPVFRASNREVSPKTNDIVIAELEKRMKARAPNSKK